MRLLARKHGLLAAFATFAFTTVLAPLAQAADVTWGGTYRVEAIKVSNPELSSAKSNKSYLLHHLVLAPKIVAADGLTIYSRLDLFNNNVFGITQVGQINSVAGDTMGNGPGAGASTNSNDSNPFSRTQRAGMLGVTSLYVSWAQEFGQLIVGRTPVEFGLGTAFNAGNGLFDHYIDTKDMIGYKLVLGNISVFPMVGKVNEGVVGEEDDVNDYLIHAQFDNPESDLSIGAIYQLRTWTFAGNDLPITNSTSNIGSTISGAPGAQTATAATRVDGGNSKLLGVFARRATGDFKIGLEADMLSGDTGLRTTGGSAVSLNAFAVAGEIGWKPADRKLSGGLKAGFATGDDPGTPETYEGFSFNRNYDVALLMFNHPLGQYDALRTGQDGSRAVPVRNAIDTESISNAIYVAPNMQYQFAETLSAGGSAVYGVLNKDPIVGGSKSKNLGFEVDLNVTWKPFDRLTWIGQAAALLPGAAWAGSQNFEQTFAYGLFTKAAISF